MRWSRALIGVCAALLVLIGGVGAYIATLDLSNVDWNERMTPSLEKIASERE